MNEELINSVFVQLTSIEEMLKERYGDQYYTKGYTTEHVSCMYAEDFILTYSYDDMVYYLSFCVDRHGYIVSEITMMILLSISIDDIRVVDDHYFNHSDKTILYGSDALHAKKRDLLSMRGQKQCVIC
jgi:hypothetical protein